MEDDAAARFSSVPWAAALINDKRWTPTPTISRILKPSGEDIFFAETLNTDRTIRKCLTLKPATEEDDELAYKETVTILEVGEGLNGYPNILHGGFVATLLDEMCGLLIVINVEERVERLGSQHSRSYFTAYLNTQYKKPVPAPGLIMCRAKIERQDGRKLFVRATIEDGAGTVYTIGDAMFIAVQPRL